MKTTGKPIMGAMVAEDQADPSLRLVDDQYMLGPDLLVAPIVEKGSTSRRVRLPRGEWFDWWSDTPVIGRDILAEAPLGTIPVYARTGVVF